MATGPLKVTTSEAPFYMTGTAEGSNPDPQACWPAAAPFSEGTFSTLETYFPT